MTHRQLPCLYDKSGTHQSQQLAMDLPTNYHQTQVMYLIGMMPNYYTRWQQYGKIKPKSARAGGWWNQAKIVFGWLPAQGNVLPEFQLSSFQYIHLSVWRSLSIDYKLRLEKPKSPRRGDYLEWTPILMRTETASKSDPTPILCVQKKSKISPNIDPIWVQKTLVGTELRSNLSTEVDFSQLFFFFSETFRQSSTN